MSLIPCKSFTHAQIFASRFYLIELFPFFIKLGHFLPQPFNSFEPLEYHLYAVSFTRLTNQRLIYLMLLPFNAMPPGGSSCYVEGAIISTSPSLNLYNFALKNLCKNKLLELSVSKIMLPQPPSVESPVSWVEVSSLSVALYGHRRY